MEVNISEMLYTMSSLLFLILGIWLIFAILSASNPNEQIALANAETLRAAMDQACLTSEEVTIKFNLPQHTPAFTGLLPVMPIWIIRTTGDPNFVMYYEAYQPGDAIGWEVHHYMQNRLVAPLPDGFQGKTEEDVFNYITQIKNGWSAYRNEKLDGIIISNIMLGEKRAHYYLGESDSAGSSSTSGTDPTAREKALKDLGKLGKWEKVTQDTGIPDEGNNRFLFNNYRALNSFEKTAIKYEPCGDHSLCLKTRNDVKRLQLDQCGNIKYVELKYDARNRAAFWGTVLGVGVIVAGTVALASGATIAVGSTIPQGAVAVAPGVYTYGGAAILGSGGAVEGVIGSAGVASSISSGVLTAVGWFGRGILNLIKYSWKGSKILTIAGVTVAVEKVAEFLGGIFLSYKVQDFHLASPCKISQLKIQKVDCSQIECKTVASYPIYEYRNEKLTTLKDAKGNDIYHRTCLEKAGQDITTLNPPTNEGFGDGKCLKVIVEEQSGGFCWTPDPYRSDPSIWDADTQKIAEELNFMPIRRNTGYISAFDAVVLKYYPVRELETWQDWFERRISWAWPGPLLSNPI